jgi:hypothetical protein
VIRPGVARPLGRPLSAIESLRPYLRKDALRVDVPFSRSGVPRNVYCWSCGAPISGGSSVCSHCGASPYGTLRDADGAPAIRVCPGCGYRGEGVRYFQRGGQALLLLGVTLFTYGIGGLIFWLAKRGSLVCPACGISWRGVRPLKGAGDAVPSGGLPERMQREMEASPATGGFRGTEEEAGGLPGGGGFLRVLGFAMALGAVLVLALAILDGEPYLGVVGSVLGIGGASLVAGGRRSDARCNGGPCAWPT